MLIFIITVLVFIACLIAAVVFNRQCFCEGLCIAAVIGTVSAGLAVVFMAVIILGNAVSVGPLLAENQAIYESMVYQMENGLYDNDNDVGKKELYDQIQAWNAYLAKGKAARENPWISWFYPDIYDEFEFIPLE